MASPNYEQLFKATAADLAALKEQADNAGADANKIGALADRIGELAARDSAVANPPAAETKTAKASGAPSA